MELNKPGIIAIILFVVMWSAIFYVLTVHPDFTFSSSKLDINEKEVKETLVYISDKDYHTLYRNFDSTIVSQQETGIESIKVKGVECSFGTAYIRFNDQCLYFDDENKLNGCLLYTENNEYGCTFGNNYGFKKGVEQTIKADYFIEPPQLFEFEGKTYIKFIAYKSGKHPTLNLGKNFFVEGALADEKYYSFDNVVVYVPYKPANGEFYKLAC
ncbi:hypothetical protein J4463_03720 [Candidatus Pacearchaeota archaeon]|nr:hypothetical protein [Candidatus Pacearchaeota archaeon]